MPVRTTANAITIDPTATTKAPCRTKRAAGKPATPAPEPTQFLERGTSSRARVLQAIALLNEVLNDHDRSPDRDTTYNVDPDGLRQLHRARGALVRSLVGPERRRNEIRFAHAAVMELGDDGSIVRDLSRALGQNALELFWCAFQDGMGATPGAFFMPNQSEDELERVGTDLEVLR